MNEFNVRWMDDALIDVADCAGQPGRHENVVAAITAANLEFVTDGSGNARHLAEGL